MAAVILNILEYSSCLWSIMLRIDQNFTSIYPKNELNWAGEIIWKICKISKM